MTAQPEQPTCACAGHTAPAAQHIHPAHPSCCGGQGEPAPITPPPASDDADCCGGGCACAGGGPSHVHADVTIFHNPRCSNSRAALALIRERGIEPLIVDYIATPLTAPELAELIAHLSVPARSLLRTKEAAYTALGLDQPDADELRILTALAAHPALLNRPIVITPRGAALCRPPEKVLELLP